MFWRPRINIAGSIVSIGIKHSIRPPPEMMPISWMPLKSVKPMARNAVAVVNAPVTIPCPVNTIAVSTAGTRLLYTNVQPTFHRLVRQAGLQPRSATCRPAMAPARGSPSRAISRAAPAVS